MSRTPPITVVLDAEDAALVGATLRMLGRTNRTPDPDANERMSRVGDQLYAAARAAGVVRTGAPQ